MVRLVAKRVAPGVRVQWHGDHGERLLMKRPEMRRRIDGIVTAIDADLDYYGGDYGHIVEDGGDRVRGAVWTRDAKAMAETARNGTLLSSTVAVTGGSA